MATTQVVHTATIGASSIKQVRTSSHRVGAVTRRAHASGYATTQQLYGAKQEEVTSITSGDVAGLAAIGTNTFCSAGLSVLSGTVTVPHKSRTNAGTFKSVTTNHPHYTGSNAYVIPTSWEAQQDSEEGAVCNAEIHWISADGTTSGAAGSTGNSITAETMNVEYALGTATINAADVPGVIGLNVVPGFTLFKQSEKGGTLPTNIFLESIDPYVDVTTHDLDDAMAFVAGFTNITAFACYFRKRSDGGQYVADGTAQHIKFSFASGISNVETIEASERGGSSGTIRVHGLTLVATTTSAIS